jgi:hypothetical protein
VGCDRGKLTLTNQRGHTMTGQSQYIPPVLLTAIQTILNTTDEPTEFDFYSDSIPRHKLIYGLAPIGAKLEKTPLVPIKYPTRQGELVYLQCAMESITDDGEAAVILPEGFFFRSGITKEIRHNLSTDFNVHILLKLPYGFFPHIGIKTSVLFFNKKPTSGTWFYDLPETKGGIEPDCLSEFIRIYQNDQIRRHQSFSIT